MFRIHAFASALLAGVATILLAATASAVTITFEVVGGSGATELSGLGTETPNGDVTSWVLDNDETYDGILIEDWNAQLKEDPYVTNNITVQNTTNATQTIIATVSLPIPAYNYDEVINSSFGVTVTDSDSLNDMSFANSGSTPVYQGIVNGSAVELTLDVPNMPLTRADCPANFPGCTATASTGTASQVAGPGTATSIAITLTFELSPMDSAGLTSRFEIVPEPGTGLLLGAGLTGLAVAGRRRRAA